MKRLIKLMMVCLVSLILLSGSVFADRDTWSAFALKYNSGRFTYKLHFEERADDDVYYQHIQNGITYKIADGLYIGGAYRLCGHIGSQDWTEHRALADAVFKSGIWKNRARLEWRIKSERVNTIRFRNKNTMHYLGMLDFGFAWLFKIPYFSYEIFVEQGKGGFYQNRRYWGLDFKVVNIFWMTQTTEGVPVKVFGISFAFKI